ncbi:MAG: hypothetical protein RSD64_01475, partial [Christensenellaceae bacterium]
MLTIVITMAGLGSRFRKAGYAVPKYQIEAHGKTLFDWSMISLDGYKSIADNYIFIVRKEDDAHDFIAARCKALDIPKYTVVELDHLTDGQATTAMLAAPYWNKDNVLKYKIIETK